MVKMIKKELGTFRGKLIFVLVMIIFTCIIVFYMETITQAKPIDQNVRVIELEIKDMVFGNNNPDIYVLLGETVRFVITNLDPGMIHEFKIKGTHTKTHALKYGEKDTIIFRAPQDERDLVYFCSWHAIIMRGNLIVRAEFPSQRFDFAHHTP